MLQNDLSELVPPNLNSQVYRNYVAAKTEPVLYDYLDFITSNQAGNIFLGSSNLNGREWQGSVWLYESSDSITDLGNPLVCRDTSTGVIDGKFLHNSNKLITGEDSGSIVMWDLQDASALVPVYLMDGHDERVNEISLWTCGTAFVTCDDSATIKIWGVKNDGLSNAHSFKNAHLAMVTSVSASPVGYEVFASCSWDKSALLWDARMDKPARVVYESETVPLTKISFNPSEPQLLAIATSAGSVYLIDERMPLDFVAKSNIFDRSIYNICFNGKSQVAVCANNNKVAVLDCKNSELDCVYCDESHEDFVRGLTWLDDNNLLSCGWDKSVIKHSI